MIISSQINMELLLFKDNRYEMEMANFHSFVDVPLLDDYGNIVRYLKQPYFDVDLDDVKQHINLKAFNELCEYYNSIYNELGYKGRNIYQFEFKEVLTNILTVFRNNQNIFMNGTDLLPTYVLCINQLLAKQVVPYEVLPIDVEKASLIEDSVRKYNYCFKMKDDIITLKSLKALVYIVSTCRNVDKQPDNNIVGTTFDGEFNVVKVNKRDGKYGEYYSHVLWYNGSSYTLWDKKSLPLGVNKLRCVLVDDKAFGDCVGRLKMVK